MCGIAGILNLDGEPVSPVDPAQRMTDAIAHRGPDGEGIYADGACGPRPSPAGDHRPLAGRPPADADARRPLRRSATTARSTTSRSCAPSSRRAATRSARAPTPKWCSTPTRSGATTALERFNGMFAFALWDSASAAAVARARPLRHQAALLRASRRHVPVRLRDQGDPRAPGAIAPSSIRKALLEYFTFQNFFTDRTLFEGVRLLAAGMLR